MLVDEVALKALLPLDQVILEAFDDQTVYEEALVSKLPSEEFCHSDSAQMQDILMDAWDDRPGVVRDHLRSVR